MLTIISILLAGIVLTYGVLTRNAVAKLRTQHVGAKAIQRRRRQLTEHVSN